MDEPLSNLDAKLRVQMRTEGAKIQSDLGTTTVYVTHDQTEAMTLGDRVAVMRTGVLQQVGQPGELYDNPANIFVGGFIGSPAMNFLPARIEGQTVNLPIGDAPLPAGVGDTAAGKSLVAGIRPESFEDAALVGDARGRGITFKAKIDLVESLGPEKFAHFSVGGDGIESADLAELAQDAGLHETPSGGEGDVVARLEAVSQIKRGDEAELWVDPSKLHLFDAETGQSLTSGRGDGAETA
jgi:multiple sugar transport system ATP-binding protein